MSAIPAISPCIGECKLDEDQVCTGCFRTIKQISQWRHLTREQQLAIVRNLTHKINTKEEL